jgi:hypothetical protein
VAEQIGPFFLRVGEALEETHSSLSHIEDVFAAEINGAAIGLGPNEVATFNAYQAAVSTNSATLHEKTWELTGLVHIGYFDGGFGLPTFEYFPEPIPSSGNPLGVPSIPELVNSIHHVERSH